VFARGTGKLGKRVSEGWPEVADFNANVMRVGLSGRTVAYRDQELTLHRNGHPAGVIAIVVETTERVLADRRAAAEQEGQRQMLRQMPGFVAMLSGPDLVFEYVNDAYVAISERAGFVGRCFRDVFADISGQGFQEFFEGVFHTGGMNWRQVADAARVFRPTLKVPFITGYAENALVGNGHLAPGMEVLTKPFVVATLGNRIREMLERALPASEAPLR
jgi:PAS domain-containing protein